MSHVWVIERFLDPENFDNHDMIFISYLFFLFFGYGGSRDEAFNE